MKRKPIILTRRIILPEVHRIISKLERLVYSVHEMKHWHLIKKSTKFETNQEKQMNTNLININFIKHVCLLLMISGRLTTLNTIG